MKSKIKLFLKTSLFVLMMFWGTISTMALSVGDVFYPTVNGNKFRCVVLNNANHVSINQYFKWGLSFSGEQVPYMFVEYSDVLTIPATIEYGGETFYVTEFDDYTNVSTPSFDDVSYSAAPYNWAINNPQQGFNCVRSKKIIIEAPIKVIPSFTFFGCPNLDTLILSSATEEIKKFAVSASPKIKYINTAELVNVQHVDTGWCEFFPTTADGDSFLCSMLDLGENVSINQYYLPSTRRKLIYNNKSPYYRNTTNLTIPAKVNFGEDSLNVTSFATHFHNGHTFPSFYAFYDFKDTSVCRLNKITIKAPIKVIPISAFAKVSFDTLILNPEVEVIRQSAFDGPSRINYINFTDLVNLKKLENWALFHFINMDVFDFSNCLNVSLSGEAILGIGSECAKLILPKKDFYANQAWIASHSCDYELVFDSIPRPNYHVFDYQVFSRNVPMTLYCDYHWKNVFSDRTDMFVESYDTVDLRNYIVEQNSWFHVRPNRGFITAHEVVIKGNNYDVATIYSDSVHYLSAMNVSLRRTFDGSKFYYFCLPFDCAIDSENFKAVDVATGDTAQIDNGDYTKDFIIFEYSESEFANGNNGSNAFHSITSGVLKAGKVYAIGVIGDASRKIEFFFEKYGDPTRKNYKFDFSKDVPLNDPISVPVTYTNSNLELDSYKNVKASGWNLIGNPYFRPISPLSFKGANYLYTIDWTGTGYVVTPRLASELDSIEPFTPVYIQVPDTVNDLYVKLVAPDSADIERAKLPKLFVEKMFEISVVSDGEEKDHTYLIDEDDASDDYVIGEDCYKMVNGGLTNIYTMIGDSIECFANKMSLDGEKMIPLSIDAAKAGNYTISMGRGRMDNDVEIYLFDSNSGEYTNLKETDAEVCLNKGANSGRFFIVTERVIAENDNSEVSGSLEAFVDGGLLRVDVPEGTAGVSVYDAAGKMVYDNPSAVGSVDVTLPCNGVYFVKAHGKTVKVVY